MKKVLLLAVLSFLSVEMSAQKWVKTTPQNKVVVLEEFTGIHCGYCPDGHKRATDLVNSYDPGKVILVNCHSGGYATPNAGEIDLRYGGSTSFDYYTGGGGYPKGMVNRVKPTNIMSGSTMACNRGEWAGEAAKILAESSPVNVAVVATLDTIKRELTTEVEAYYTASSASAKNYMTVELLEDGVLGYQSDYGNFNPSNWVTVNGKTLYKHNHVLRANINVIYFGEAITTTTSGSYFYKKYTTKIPATYNGTAPNLKNLRVVAFVSENNGNIYSGSERVVEIPGIVGMSENTTPSNLNIYPNPSSNNSTVNFSVYGNKLVSLEIINVNGQKVQSIISGNLLSEGNYDYDINTADLAEGIYLVKLSIGERTFNQRLSVIH